MISKKEEIWQEINILTLLYKNENVNKNYRQMATPYY